MEPKFESINIRAIIGLGNPGKKYQNHRHSIGFRVLDELASRLGGQWHSTDTMEYAAVRHNNQEVYLIKPLTFMNDSGRVVPWLQKKGIKSEQVLVVHDELEKKFGQLVFKFGGSHKGHNGLRSLMGAMGADFWRLKFGIDRPSDRTEVPTYVLSDFSRQEEVQIPLLVEESVAVILA